VVEREALVEQPEKRIPAAMTARRSEVFIGFLLLSFQNNRVRVSRRKKIRSFQRDEVPPASGRFAEKCTA